MSDMKDGHGLDEYLALLAKIPKEVNVSVMGGAKSKADFDRAVRESVDRQHRRRVIAEN